MLRKIPKGKLLFLLLIIILILAWNIHDEWTFHVSLYGVAVFIGYFFAINIHELGHLFFGKICGYKLLSYRIGSLTWNNVNGKMKFAIIKNEGYDGACAMVSQKEEIPTFFNVLYFAGGVLFNIIFGLVCLSLFFLSGNKVLINIFLIIGFISILAGLLNSIPFMVSNYASDGKIVWSIILKKTYANELIMLQKMQNQLSVGIRPKDLIIPNKHNFTHQQFIPFINLYLYLQALDNEHLDEANNYLNLIQKNINLFSSISTPGILYELCFMNCINGELDKAQDNYHKIAKTINQDKDINGRRVKAYYEYYVNKNKELAKQLCLEGLKVADKFISKGHAKMEVDLINKLMILL